MHRIQGPFAKRDVEDEKKKARESVLSNLVVFAIICGLIRAGPLLTQKF